MKCFPKIFKGKSRSSSAPQASSSSSSSDKNNNKSASVVRSTRSLPSPRSIQELYKEKEQNLRVFSIKELKEATNGFNRLLKIGEGGFGSVYKGTVSAATDSSADGGGGERLIVAIKKLNKHGLQGHKQWVAEVQFLGIVNHPNLVKLLGYCSVDDERGIQRLLVYEYMPNKSLEDHLFNSALPVLPWRKRLEIMLGAAEGLAYLHCGLEVPVIYRDFKCSNVLLDEGFNPRLSDFGLAREGPTGDRTHVSTGVVGTHGYAAPEYIETGHLTIHSDLWSFGVVLYEILTGRRSLERNRPTSEQKLLDWVKQFPADSKKLCMIIDPRLRSGYSMTSARRVAKLADKCLNKHAKDRPSMGEVAEVLKLAIRDTEEPANGTAK
ncbi:Probable serine/threonine-protein kinase PBL19 [Linum grandiflorum]